MAHYVFLDENNIVTEVIVGIDETELIEGLDPETWYGNFKGQVCKRTSYNTVANQHMLGGIPFRGNAAGIGMIYDSENDVFYPQQPYPSWNLNTDLWIWQPPVPRPEDGFGYKWVEESLSWQPV